MSPIEDVRTAHERAHQLEDQLNEAITELIQARHQHTTQIDHHAGSVHTEKAFAAVRVVMGLEEDLVDYQGRAETYPEHVLEAAS